MKTGANIFLTGEPGSGKTFVTNGYVSFLKRAKVDVAVTASTGIAATHIGGRTIQSWSGIGINKSLTSWELDRIASNEWVAKRILRTRVLIVDEISMLDGRTLYSVDRICREVKQSRDPFGGMQVIFVGDFFQLPPVSREEEGPSQFAFDSDAWRDAKPVTCYLSEQHRQEDYLFSSLLSSLRRNSVTTAETASLQDRCVEDEALVPEGALKLFTHNADVDAINHAELSRLEEEPKTFCMTSSGKRSLVEQLKRGCLSPEELTLKVGASVMFTKNNQRGSFVNGTLGTVVAFDETSGYPIVKTRDNRLVTAELSEWSLEEHGRVAARIVQIPLRLAWAITVHKSQGMSLDAALVDLRHAFVEGQGYVALSRVRTLGGLSLIGWNDMALRVHPKILVEDESFRGASAEAVSAFGSISSAELSRMHERFVKTCGGVVPVSKEEKEDSATGLSPLPRIRQKHPKAYRPWNKEEEDRLRGLHQGGASIKAMAEALGRKAGGIRARLLKMEMLT